MDGSMITNASRSTDTQTNQPDVSISFNQPGSDLFCAFTRERVAHPQGDPQNKLAIFIDKDLVEDATVISEIGGGGPAPTRRLTPARCPRPPPHPHPRPLPGPP